MDISKEIETLALNKPYQIQIFGLGEVYEIMSVESLRKKLWQKYDSGWLYLATNKDHKGRGITLEDLEDYLRNQQSTIIKKGYVDSPPWSSRPLGERREKEYNKIIVFLAQIIFFFLLRLEFLWQGKKKSHMIYCLVR